MAGYTQIGLWLDDGAKEKDRSCFIVSNGKCEWAICNDLRELVHTAKNPAYDSAGVRDTSSINPILVDVHKTNTHALVFVTNKVSHANLYACEIRN